ncbi:MAG: phosphate acyltransferase PlsX [Crocinitomicaceae bacterium]|nr:phosphate acyltransferase PlsX [Crocinitomicaceae bacterium]
MRIGLDISGGDFAPKATIDGALLAREVLSNDVTIVLLGDEEIIRSEFAKRGKVLDGFEIVHAPEVITYHDHPTRAIPKKTNSSISIGFDLLAKAHLDVFASTGNTGAMLVGAMYKLNTVPGIIRPCITSTLPAMDGSQAILLDVGSNADCKADVLYQFAVLGALYSQHVHGVENPRVALLNIGEEDSKGNLLTIAAYKLLSESDELNFTGNIEGRDLFTGVADVIVCDGFTGNIVLKEAEGIYTLMRKRGIRDEYFDRFNYENYGGTPILGVKGNAVIGHGISNDIAIKNMLLHSYEVAASGLSTKINDAFN